MSVFKLLADENIAVAVIDQLTGRDIDITRVRHVMSEGTPDPDLLEYAHENGYALLTHDQKITRHIVPRRQRTRCVFIARQAPRTIVIYPGIPCVDRSSPCRIEDIATPWY